MIPAIIMTAADRITVGLMEEDITAGSTAGALADIIDVMNENKTRRQISS